MSRPERKALERRRKEQQQSKKKPKNGNAEPHLRLSSLAVSELNEGSSPQDVLRAIKRAQNLHEVHDLQNIERFLLEYTDDGFAFGYKGSILARLAVAAMHMDEPDIASRAIAVRRVHYRRSIRPMESAAIIRGLLRLHNVTGALEILRDELPLPLEGDNMTDPETKDRIKYRALSLASVASRHFYEGEPTMAVLACQRLAEMGPVVRRAELEALYLEMPWARLLKGASQCEAGRREGTVPNCQGIDVKLPCNLVYAVLNAMTTFPSENNDEVYELLSNALVRRTVFVTGAIDMSGCPAPDRGEAVFIGRSNVGKSSLVNMVTNRKSLAFTSKRPGKTQQFNFFAINDKPGREKEIKYGDEVLGEKDSDSFYIVDIPGFGYARVPDKQREAWRAFTKDYIMNRKTLRVVFHLIDGRHGPTEEDASTMRKLSEQLPPYVKNVIVLTKADKNVKGPSSIQNAGKVSENVMNRLRSVMEENGVGTAPVILTSAQTKLGRDDVWRYLRLAAEAEVS